MAADFSRLTETCQAIVSSADIVHLDIMDGHFASPMTMGPHIVAAIRKLTPLPLDLHLMVEYPEEFLEVLRLAGADRIAVHWETCRDPWAVLGRIRDLGALAGIAVTLETPISVLRAVLPRADYVVIVSVDLHGADHGFQPAAIEKIREVVGMRGDDSRPQIAVDGAITPQTAASVKKAGADILIAGGAIFNGGNPQQAIHRLRDA